MRVREGLIVGAVACCLVMPAGALEVPVEEGTLDDQLRSALQLRFNPSGSRDFNLLSVIPDDEFRAILGKGFDVFEGKLLNEPPCVEEAGNSDQDTLENGAAPSYGTFWSDAVTGMATHQSSSGTSANFGVTYKLLSAGYETGARSENWFNTSDGYGRVYNRIVTRVQYRDGGQWARAANDLLANRDIKGFLKRCSSHYVQAIYSGHLIDETLWFELRKEKRTASDSDSLSFGIKGLLSLGTSDASSSTTVKELSISRNERASRGIVATQQPPAKDVDAIASLVDFGKYEFGNQVAAALPNKAAILLINVVPYRERTFPRVNRIPEWPEKIFSLMGQKTNLLYQLATAISDLRYATRLDNATYDKLYSAPPYGDLGGKLTDAVALREEYKTAIDVCRAQMLSDTGTEAEKTCRWAIGPTLQLAKIAGVSLARKHGS